MPIADAITATSLPQARKGGSEEASAASAPTVPPTPTMPAPSVADKVRKKVNSKGNILVKADCVSKKSVSCVRQEDGSQNCHQTGEVECARLWMASTSSGDAMGGPIWDLLSA